MLLLLVVWLVFGIASSLVASNRGGSGCLFFVLGCVFGPLALLCAFFEGAECPHCRSKIHTKATKCPKCQSELPREKSVDRPVIPLDEGLISQPLRPPSARENQVVVVVIWIVGLLIAGALLTLWLLGKL